MTPEEQRDRLADALDSFFYDLAYTAPEAWSMRVQELANRINPTMADLGFPKKGAAEELAA